MMACGVGGLYLPFFPRWLEARGMVGLRLGVIAAVAPAMGVFAPTVFGALADTLRVRRGLLQLACAGALLTFGALTAAAALGVPLRFGVLFLVALFFALFRSPMGFIADVVAIELAPAVGTSYGRLRLWGSLGFIAAVLPASRYVDPGASLVFPAVTTAVVAAALLASLRLPAPPLPEAAHGPKSSAWQSLLCGDFRLFLLAVFLGQAGHVAYDLCFSMHLVDLGAQPMTVGLGWALGTGSEVLLMAYSAPVFRALPEPQLFALALGAASVRWALIAAVRSPALLLALQPLHALSFGLCWLASVSYVSRRFPSSSLATGQGLFATATGAGSVVGMLAWGSAYHRAGGASVFAAASCLSALACGIALALDRKVRPRTREPAVEGASAAE